MIDEIELKPCPFCGGRGRIRKIENGYAVVCGKCGAQGTRIVVKAWHRNRFIAQCQAAHAWNRRANGNDNI